ncbi:MAG: hypothetical protein KUG79_08365 [Pseudomonadales bacterium]|nr:hypothetical protein [Pseudomonadales bacterium]
MKICKFNSFLLGAIIALTGCGQNELMEAISGVPNVQISTSGNIVQRLQICHYVLEDQVDVMLVELNKHDLDQIYTPTFIDKVCKNDQSQPSGRTILGSIEAEGLFDFLKNAGQNYHVKLECHRNKLDIHTIEVGSGYRIVNCEGTNVISTNDLSKMKLSILSSIATTGEFR